MNTPLPNSDESDDAQEGIGASLEQLLNSHIDVHDVLPIVVCLDELVASLRHARSATWRRDQRSSLAKDFDAAFDVVGGRTREALGNAASEVHDLVRRVLNSPRKVSEHSDFNRLLSETEALCQRLVDADVRRASWRDVVEGLRGGLPERVLEDRFRLLFALLGATHLEPEEDRQHLHWVIAEGGVPESGPGSEAAALGTTERLALCEEYVSRTVPSENCIAWVALDGTFLPEFVVEAGPITFFLAEWVVPNAQQDDGQMFLHRDELREIVMNSLFEVPHETNVVLARGAPRWMLIDGSETLTDLREIADRLRDLLRDEPQNRPLDAAAVTQLNRFLDTATAEERRLLPLRMRRAVMQMSKVLQRWSAQANREGDGQRADEWLALERLASAEEPPVDPYLIAERWLGLVTPSLERYREENRRARYVLLRDIEPQLINNPLPYAEVREVFAGLPSAVPLEQRVSACIIGVPEH